MPSVSAQGVFWDWGVYFISQPRGKALNHNINMGENFEAKEATRFLSDFFRIIGSIQYSLFMFLSVDFFFHLNNIRSLHKVFSNWKKSIYLAYSLGRLINVSLSLRGRFSDQIVVQTVYSDELIIIIVYLHICFLSMCLVFVRNLFWSMHSFLLYFLYLGIYFGDEAV